MQTDSATLGFVYLQHSNDFKPSVGPFGNFNVGSALMFVSSFLVVSQNLSADGAEQAWALNLIVRMSKI